MATMRVGMTTRRKMISVVSQMEKVNTKRAQRENIHLGAQRKRMHMPKCKQLSNGWHGTNLHRKDIDKFFELSRKRFKTKTKG